MRIKQTETNWRTYCDEYVAYSQQLRAMAVTTSSASPGFGINQAFVGFAFTLVSSHTSLDYIARH